MIPTNQFKINLTECSSIAIPTFHALDSHERLVENLLDRLEITSIIIDSFITE